MRRIAVATLVLLTCAFVILSSAAFARLDNVYIAAPYVWGERTISWSNYVSIVPNRSVHHVLYGAKAGGGLEEIRLDAPVPVLQISPDTYVAITNEKRYDPSNLSWGGIVYGARADGGIDMFVKSDNAWTSRRAEIEGVPITRQYISLACSGNYPGQPPVVYNIYAVRADGKGIDRLIWHPEADGVPAHWTLDESIGSLEIGGRHEVAYTKVVTPPEYPHIMYALRADGRVDAIFTDGTSPFDVLQVYRNDIPNGENVTYVDISEGPGSYTITFAARSDGGIDRFFFPVGGDEVRPPTDPVYVKLSPDAGTNHCIYAITQEAPHTGMYRISWDVNYWNETGIVRWPLNKMSSNSYSLLTYNARYGNEMYAQADASVPPTATTIDQVKASLNAVPVEIPGALVSAVIPTDDPEYIARPGSFGIIAPDGSRGIRVIWDPQNPEDRVEAGDIVDIAGVVGMSGYYERVVVASSVVKTGTGEVPRPVAMTNRASGGGAVGQQDAVADHATPAAIVRAQGLNNIGLPVTIFGKVTAVHADAVYPFTAGYFYIDDGSGLIDGSATNVDGESVPNVGIKCRPYLDIFGAAALPVPGEYVSVTGLIGCRKPSEDGFHPARYLWTTSVETYPQFP